VLRFAASPLIRRNARIEFGLEFGKVYQTVEVSCQLVEPALLTKDVINFERETGDG
jgi:hypothetical protein